MLLVVFSVHPPSYLDLIFDFPSKVSNDEGRLHDWCGHKVFVSPVLLLEFGQQCLICGMGKAGAQAERGERKQTESGGEKYVSD